MMQKPWFKAFIWFMASTFFFMASGVLISHFSLGPTETQVMQYMSGMMAAMGSLMGLSMTLEADGSLRQIIALAASLTVPMLFLGVLFGIYVRCFRGKEDNAKK